MGVKIKNNSPIFDFISGPEKPPQKSFRGENIKTVEYSGRKVEKNLHLRNFRRRKSLK